MALKTNLEIPNASAIGMYLSLKDGESADLSIIAGAALAWDALIKEFAYIVDPSLEIRVELLSGEQGSLWLKALIKSVKKVKNENPNIVAIIAAALAAFLISPVNQLSDKAWSMLLNEMGIISDPKATLTKQDIKDITAAIKANIPNQRAVEKKNEIYRQIERDPSVTGIGANTSLQSKPSVVVARKDFHLRMSVPQEKTIITEHREISKSDLRVTLIRPVLIPEQKSWQFRVGDDQFGAVMEDPVFLKRIASGHTGIELGQGVEMVINVRIQQDKKNGVWHNAKTFVTKVVSTHLAPGHPELFKN